MITFMYGDTIVTAANILADPEGHDGLVVAWNGDMGRIDFDPHLGDCWYHHFELSTWYLVTEDQLTPFTAAEMELRRKSRESRN